MDKYRLVTESLVWESPVDFESLVNVYYSKERYEHSGDVTWNIHPETHRKTVDDLLSSPSEGVRELGMDLLRGRIFNDPLIVDESFPLGVMQLKISQVYYRPF